MTATILRLEHAPPGVLGVDAIDARCLRFSLSWTGGPLCCARGAAIDARRKLTLVRALPDLRWSPEGPILDGYSPSGVVERLAEADGVCAASAGDPARGEGCRIRALDPSLLNEGCALFPLDVVDRVLVPSPRIPASALVPLADPIISLWDEARPRFAALYGDAAAEIVDAAARDFRGHRARHLHLKTVR